MGPKNCRLKIHEKSVRSEGKDTYKIKYKALVIYANVMSIILLTGGHVSKLKI